MFSIEKVSVIDLVVDEIKKYILSSENQVGSKLPTEKELCTRLNVGRSTIREALRILQARGFVQVEHGRGAFIARNTETENCTGIARWFAENKIVLTDFMEVRMALEPLAVKLAILKGNDAKIKTLEDIHAKFKEAVETGNSSDMAKYDEEFHNQIVHLSNNALMESINSNISEAFKQYRIMAFSVGEYAANALSPHEMILSAIKKRDIEAGQQAMTEHIVISIEDMRRVVEKVH